MSNAHQSQSQAHLSAQTQHFLANCSREELEKMLAIIKPRTDALKPTKTKASKPTGVTKRATAAAASAPSHGNSVAKRPLNSWMAFRAYYHCLFKEQQKDISGFLRKLWKADPFQAKWAILAKAYSMIRDVRGKYYAPLDSFLSVAAPHIGILSPTDYLPRLGWSFVVEEGVKSIRRTTLPALDTFEQSLVTTNLDPYDIIRFCRTQGFVDQATLDLCAGAPSMTMAAIPSMNTFLGHQQLSQNNVATYSSSQSSNSPSNDQYAGSPTMVNNNSIAAATGTDNHGGIPTNVPSSYASATNGIVGQQTPSTTTSDDLPIFDPQSTNILDPLDPGSLGPFDFDYFNDETYNFDPTLFDSADFDMYINEDSPAS